MSLRSLSTPPPAPMRSSEVYVNATWNICSFCQDLAPPLENGIVWCQHPHNLAQLRDYAGEDDIDCAFCDVLLHAFGNSWDIKPDPVRDAKTTFVVGPVQWVKKPSGGWWFECAVSPMRDGARLLMEPVAVFPIESLGKSG